MHFLYFRLESHGSSPLATYVFIILSSFRFPFFHAYIAFCLAFRAIQTQTNIGFHSLSQCYHMQNSYDNLVCTKMLPGCYRLYKVVRTCNALTAPDAIVQHSYRATIPCKCHRSPLTLRTIQYKDNHACIKRFRLPVLSSRKPLFL